MNAAGAVLDERVDEDCQHRRCTDRKIQPGTFWETGAPHTELSGCCRRDNCCAYSSGLSVPALAQCLNERDFRSRRKRSEHGSTKQRARGIILHASVQIFAEAVPNFAKRAVHARSHEIVRTDEHRTKAPIPLDDAREVVIFRDACANAFVSTECFQCMTAAK